MKQKVRPDSKRLDEKAPGRAWGMLAVTYLASICAPLVQFKVPPLANWLFANFAAVGLDGATFGMLMSMLSIIGVILAFPAAFICRKFGLKNTVLVSLACLCGGSIISAVATNIPVLMISRLIEGFGIGLIGVAAPTCVSVWFPPRQRGLALGLWSTWVPLGCTLMFLIAPGMAGGNPGMAPKGYLTVFWFCAIFCAIAFILFAAVYRMPEGKSGDMGIEGTFRDSLPYLKNRYIWYLGIVFFALCSCTLGIVTTFYQQFLTAPDPFGLGMSDSLAGLISGITMAMSLVFAPIAGSVSDHLKPNSKHWIATGSGIALLVAVFFGFVPGENGMACLVVFVLIQGVAGAFVAGGCRPMAPMIMGGTAMGATIGMAVLQFCQNLGSAIGSPLFGALLDSFGGNFFMASCVLQIPLLILGIVFAAILRPFHGNSPHAAQGHGGHHGHGHGHDHAAEHQGEGAPVQNA
jgi:MFS family permease